uniref:Uncharacterized protein n=1 Tax=Anguilla anguilla TaxID=7936 RepID=A0A0E9V949_ANGAN
MRKAPGDLSEHHCYVTVGVIPFPSSPCEFWR